MSSPTLVPVLIAHEPDHLIPEVLLALARRSASKFYHLTLHRDNLVLLLLHMAAVVAGIRPTRPQRTTLRALAILFDLIRRLLLRLLFALIKFIYALLEDFFPVLTKPQVVTRMIQPDGKLFALAAAHHPAHLLYV